MRRRHRTRIEVILLERTSNTIGYREDRLRYSDKCLTHTLLNHHNKKGDCMVDLHWHDYYELLYVKEGSAIQVVNGAQELMEVGDIALIKPGAQHATYAVGENGCNMLVVLFFLPGLNFENMLSIGSEFLMPFLQSDPRTGGVYSHIGRDDKQVIYITHQIETELYLQEKGFEVVIQGLLYQMLGLLIRDGKFENPHAVPSGQLDVVRRVCKHIEANCGNDIRLRTVASMFGYTPEYFSKLFSSVVGRSYKSYCEFVRMSVAEQLLRQKLSVQETANRVGYESVSGFIRAYKRIKNCSPQHTQETHCLM